ncbi:LPS translocon maturation chaperone LptM [Serratia sp. L9]|uniref:LPS translocon maturation chaperone LptM n=1 Tax=Serratia sp. L9 TaxID=3423946 RepID=UPI003D6712CF
MKKQLRYALMAVMLAGLSGCGLKGPLYFPPSDKPATKPMTNDDSVSKNQQEPAGTQQHPSMSSQ